MRPTLVVQIITVFSLSIIAATAWAAEPSRFLIQVSPKYCKHGLHPQPNGGPFSVFLFCDDAAGSNIGVILTEPGAGPGSIELTGTKVWDAWDTNDRFWQEKEWATDVVSVAWSPSLRYLYVATSGIYGDGGLFKLNLTDRKAERLLPSYSAPYINALRKHGYYTIVEKIDLNRRTLKVRLHIFDSDETLVATEEVQLE